MQVKTSSLEGVQLDWAVAKCKGYVDDIIKMSSGVHTPVVVFDPESKDMFSMVCGQIYSPSTLWEQGGSIIESERITLDAREKD